MIIPRGDDIIPRGDDIIPRGDDIIPRGDDKIPRGDDNPFRTKKFWGVQMLEIHKLQPPINHSGQITIYFTNQDIPEIRGFPFLSYVLG